MSQSDDVRIDKMDNGVMVPEREPRDSSKPDAGASADIDAEADEVHYPECQSQDMMSRSASLSLWRDEMLPCQEDTQEEAYVPQYEAKHNMPVVIVTSEISPWSKSGGLALVTASLALEFAERGRRTMAISPMYDYYEGATYVATQKVWLFHCEHEVKFFHMWKQVGENTGVDYVFVDHPCFHRPGGLYYNAKEDVEYADNLFRFALFTLASLEAPTALYLGGANYGDKVLFLANDWQSALLPVYLTHRFRPQQRYVESRCIFVVHNFGYQGIYPHNKLVDNPDGCIPMVMKNVDVWDLGLGDTGAYEHLVYQYPPEKRSFDGDDGNVWNLSKGALLTCDRLLTVSPGYANEMKTFEGGFSLEEIAKSKEFFFTGILNGIDVHAWNPRTDPHIAVQYNLDNMVEAKRVCKLQLQERVGLEQNEDVALVGFVGRLTHQKGIDLILESLEWMMTPDGNPVTGKVQVLLIGNGDEHYVHQLNHIAHRFPGRCIWQQFEPLLEHLLYAGADMLFMPSRYEPCGLPQMCAQRYGAVPIVTMCGGLNDSVVVEPESEATGFGILPLSACKLKEVAYKAVETYYNKPDEFRAMQIRGFQTDFSWGPRIDEYEKTFDWAMTDPPFVRW